MTAGEGQAQRRGDVYVVDGSRTPFLRAGERPGPGTAADLAVAAARPLLARQRFEATALDEVILGCVMPGADEANVARIVALRLGCGHAVPAWTVQRNSGSGLQALDSACAAIAAGRADLVLAGGTEAMSRAPVLLGDEMTRWLVAWHAARGPGGKAAVLARLRLRHLAPVAGLARGLIDPVAGLSTGQTAENLAWRFRIDRARMDAFAADSHRRLAQAQDAGRLEEIEALYDTAGGCYEHDDGLRRDATPERLARLKPAFEPPFGLVTAGNSAPFCDGAALLLLASRRAVETHDLPVLGRIVDCAWAGVDPAAMGLGPAHAMAMLLRRHTLGVADIDGWEIHESFAAQVLAVIAAWQDPVYCRDELGLDAPLGEIPVERLNVDGGGISLGHPVGASGARLVLHLLHVLMHRRARRGIAGVCVGGGQGGAMLLERGDPA